MSLGSAADKTLVVGVAPACGGLSTSNTVGVLRQTVNTMADSKPQIDVAAILGPLAGRCDSVATIDFDGNLGRDLANFGAAIFSKEALIC